MTDLLTLNDAPGTYPPSYYAAQDILAPMPGLQGDHNCDVCVIGGGFTGLSSALHLAERGYSVMVLEAQRVGFGASGRNGGHVGLGQHKDQDELEVMMGHDAARALWEISVNAVEMVRDFCARDEVYTSFHEGIIGALHKEKFLPESRSYVRYLRENYDCDIRFLEREELREIVKSDFYKGGYIWGRSGHVDPLQLALGLARIALKNGAQIFERSRAVQIREGQNIEITTDTGARVTANHLVLACNAYLGELNRHVSARVMPVNSYIVATEPMSEDQRARIMTRNVAVSDSKFALNYYRFSDDNRLLFGGAEGYRYKFHTDIAAKSRRSLSEVFPQLDGIGIDYAWGGTLAITRNRMPHFERLAGNILTMSGYSGHGVALGTYAGKIAAEAIAGQAEQFDVMASVPTRPFPGGMSLRAPLLFLAMSWYALRDRL